MQAIPENISSKQIEEHLLTFDEISGIHDLHIWSIDGSYNILTVHIILKSAFSNNQIATLKSKIRGSLMEKDIQHATIEFEDINEKCNLEHCC